jgi:hypothetical protein
VDFVAIDADTKLVPAYRIGKRTRVEAIYFIHDLASRLSNRVQLSTDGHRTYVDALERAFGAEVDYGKPVKFYEVEPIGPGRYAWWTWSAPRSRARRTKPIFRPASLSGRTSPCA